MQENESGCFLLNTVLLAFCIVLSIALYCVSIVCGDESTEAKERE